MPPKLTKGSEAKAFWTRYQPGFTFSSAPPGTAAFFQDVRRHRYELEPHIPQVVDFEAWSASRVVEVGCGIGTDGIRFSESGAEYFGLDRSATAVEMAQRHRNLMGHESRLGRANTAEIPIRDGAAELVYSHGVIHHTDDPEQAVREFRRILRPGGTAIVMVYHRHSLNYWVNILVIRRVLAALLLIPGAASIVRHLGLDSALVEGHRQLLREHGWRYLVDRSLFLSNNTDGPGNPLSKVYSRRQARELFSCFEEVHMETRFLNLRLYPRGNQLSRTSLARRLEKRIGWHLYVRAR